MSVQIIDANIIKKTQDSLGKIIKKPPMTEKLLSKPPFRFLHDIMTSVIKTTGFMNGLFADTEMNSDNVKEKEAKIAFLQKVIDMISLVLGKTLSARPSQIIYGSEPEKTNEMLQMLAEAINKKIDNDEYVQRVLRPDDEATKNKKESSKHKRDEKDIKQNHKKDSSPSKKERRHRSKNEDERRRDDDRSKKKDKSKHEDEDRKKEPKKESRRHERSEERSKEKKDEGDKHGGSERHRSRRRGDDDDDDGKHERKKHSRREDGERTNKMEEEEKKNEPTVKIDDAENSIQVAAKPPVSANKSRSAQPERPSSARPAPPKPRKKEDTQEEISKLNSSVIIDKKIVSDGDDDDDDFIVKEDTNEQWMKQEAEGLQNEALEGDHGILVKKILDTKKELETNTNYTKKTEIELSEGVVEASKMKDRQLMSKEIEKIRCLIQGTTRNINPLGKTLDFLQEDMDSMLREMNMWTEETKHNRKLLNEERSKTEAILEPLKAQFKDLEISISEQLDQISAVKNNILTNDKKLNAMLASVMQS